MSKKVELKPEFVSNRRSATVPNMGFSPGEWIRRYQSGAAVPPAPSEVSIASDIDAKLMRPNIDLNRRREIIAAHKVKFAVPPAFDASNPPKNEEKNETVASNPTEGN